MKRSLFILAAVLPLLPLQAEVFSLWPFGGGGSVASSPDDVLSPQTLWNETILADGRKLQMNVAMVDTPLPRCYELLKKEFPKASFALNSTTLLMEQTRKDGWRERVLLISVKGVAPVLRFAMTVPPKTGVPEWPKRFPLPPGAVPVSVMEFPERNATYGAFTSTEPVRNILSCMASNLRSSGWTPVSNETNAAAGTGEVFVKNSTHEMLIIGTRRDESKGTVFCSVYARKLK